jgi:hypothetical protein
MALHPDRTKVPLTGPATRRLVEADIAVLRSAGRGQEFVVGMRDDTRAWVRSLLTGGA